MADLQQQQQLPPRPATDIFGDPIDAQPLWFKKSSFLQPEFDPEAYVADLRTFVPFESLRSELRSYLAGLKTELVDHLNRDYADFVSLSTRLVDVDAAVARMRAPLAELRDKVAVLRGNIASSLAALRGGLGQRAEASEAREVLELLLDAFHVVSNVEKLIQSLHSMPADLSNVDAVTLQRGSLSNGNFLQNNEALVNPEKAWSVHLERIASEMNRLKFYIAHAQKLPFIENMEKRIQNASLLLDGSLRHCFIAGLEQNDHEAILNCLRAYAAIDNTTGAEEIFRSTIVSPLIQKIIPHSPSEVVGSASSDELEEDYQQIMQCIEAGCKFFLDVSSSANSGFHVFDFLANSVLKEVLFAIQKGKPGAFSPGKPTEFLRNYKASLGFLSYLEGYCLSRSAVARFRSGDVYIEFMKQWNVGVYFSLRFQEIAGALDSALMVATITLVQKLHSTQGNCKELMLKQSSTLLESLRSCWREDILVLSCSDKFLKLSLQLLSRYSTWLSSGLSARRARGAGSNASPSSEWAISASPEDFIYVIRDIGYLVTEVTGEYLRHVLELLHSCSPDILDLVNHSILQAGKSLEGLVPALVDAIIEAVVEKSVEDLRQLKGITATYRMTNKPPPVRHSPYVSGVLRPLKAFLDGERAALLMTETRNQLLLGATERITGRYYELASDLVSVARKTESSLQKIRQGAQRRAGANADASDNNISDTDKICMQLFLDIQEYGHNLAAIGVAAADIPAYRSLWQCVAPSERTLASF